MFFFFFSFFVEPLTVRRCKIPCDLACMRSVPNQPYLIIMLCSDSLLLIWVLPQFDFVHEISVWFTCLIELNAQIEQENKTIPFGLRLFFRRLPLPPFMIHSMVFPTMKILVFGHIVMVAPCIQTHRLIVRVVRYTQPIHFHIQSLRIKWISSCLFNMAHSDLHSFILGICDDKNERRKANCILRLSFASVLFDVRDWFGPTPNA